MFLFLYGFSYFCIGINSFTMFSFYSVILSSAWVSPPFPEKAQSDLCAYAHGRFLSLFGVGLAPICIILFLYYHIYAVVSTGLFCFLKNDRRVCEITMDTNIRTNPMRVAAVSRSFINTTEKSAPNTDSRLRMSEAAEGSTNFCPRF